MAADREQFSYRTTKDGRVRVAFHGRHVVTLAGSDAQRLTSRLEGAGDDRTQLLLAKATGNFKHGNERR
ncbi:MAG: hypothetical protein M3550_00440 [Actinomycetota bacterium]|nr:hypothetical protein [Actinomycetota bacterium]